MCCKVQPTANTAPACRWVHEYTPPCPQYPVGATGILEITSYTKRGPVTACYSVDCVLDRGRIVGWELEHLDSEVVYHIDHLSWGWSQASCDCGSCVFGNRTCKHVLALHRSLKEIGFES